MMDAGPTKHKFHTHQRAAAAVIDVATRATMATRQPSMPRGPCVSKVARVSSKAIDAAAHATMDVERSRHTSMAAPKPTTAHAARDAVPRARIALPPPSRRRVRIHADAAAAMPHKATGVDAAISADCASWPADPINAINDVPVPVTIADVVVASASIVVVSVTEGLGYGVLCSNRRADRRTLNWIGVLLIDQSTGR